MNKQEKREFITAIAVASLLVFLCANWILAPVEA
jgi:hypothetical protein